MLRGLFRNLFRRRQVERDLDQELRSYADMLADEKAQSGMTRPEAERAARIELGGIEQVKEQVRASRTGAWLDTLAGDLRYASPHPAAKSRFRGRRGASRSLWASARIRRCSAS